MTTELEKQFFDTFGIYLREARICRNVNNCSKKYELCNDDCKHWQAIRKEYPQITDRQYLELICLVNERRILPNCNVNELKEYILKELCTMIISESFKHQVQAIFKGE